MSTTPIIASVDAGNGGTNAVVSTAKSYKAHYMPSTRAIVTGQQLKMNGLLAKVDFEFADFEGRRFVAGDDVLTLGAKRQEHHIGQNRYGSEMHRFLVADTLSRLGVKSGAVELVVFIPPSLYNQKHEAIREAFEAEPVVIQRRGDSKPRHWVYSEVKVLPEGYPAAVAMMFNDQGQVVKTDILSGTVAILDCGLFTVDTLLVTNGALSQDTLDSASVFNGGLNEHIRKPILSAVRSIDDDFNTVTIDHIDQVIRRGLDNGDYTLTVAGKTADLAEQVMAHIDNYANWVASEVIDSTELGGLRGIDRLIVIGGGGLLITPHLKSWYAGKVVDLATHSTTRKVSPTELNAVGGLRYMRAKRLQGA